MQDDVISTSPMHVCCSCSVHNPQSKGQPLSGSTKSMTGHTLGAAGAVELALSYLALSEVNAEGLVPPHVWDGVVDPALPVLKLAPVNHRAPLKIIMSNSFAFGGNNVSLIVSRG